MTNGNGVINGNGNVRKVVESIVRITLTVVSIGAVGGGAFFGYGKLNQKLTTVDERSTANTAAIAAMHKTQIDYAERNADAIARVRESQARTEEIVKAIKWQLFKGVE